MAGQPSVFFGRAAVYNEWSQKLFGSFREQLAPGCFDECLDQAGDIVCTVNHDLRQVLGRTSASTLKIHRASDGVDVEVAFGDYTFARDLAVAIRRGDLRGMSFIFDVVSDTWARGQDGVPERTVLKADIFETSFVYHPAYEQTEAGVRWAPLALPVCGEERAKAKAREVEVRPFAGLAKARVRLRELDI